MDPVEKLRPVLLIQLRVVGPLVPEGRRSGALFRRKLGGEKSRDAAHDRKISAARWARQRALDNLCVFFAFGTQRERAAARPAGQVVEESALHCVGWRVCQYI